MFQFGYSIYGVVVLLLTYVVYRFIKWQIILHRVFKIPGPKKLPIVHNFFDLVNKNEAELFQVQRKWNKLYGPVSQVSILGKAAVNICGPKEFEVIASTMRHLQKGEIYDFLHPWLGKGLLTNTGPEWQVRRKILTPAFHFSILQQFVHIFNNETNKLVEKLKEECTESSTNVVPLLLNMSLYTIAETSFGTRLDEKNSEHRKYMSAIEEIGKLIIYRLLRPWLENETIFKLTSLGKKYVKCLKTLHELPNKIINEKSKTFKPVEDIDDGSLGKKKLTFLDLLLTAKIRDGIIDDTGIQDEVNTFMFEGHETTAMSACFTLLLLAEHKDYQQLIYEEMISVLGDKHKQPDMTDLNELKLTERFIKESLRLYPSVPMISRFLDSDVTLNGYTIPKEIAINIWIYDIHRDPKYWPNPDKFDPDRFLTENSVGRHPYSYVPFSAGPRNCIGQKYAILELKALLCGILRNYVIDVVDTSDDIEVIVNLVLRIQKGTMNLKFTPRTNS